MSYPRRIHTLIVEDEAVARRDYQHLFDVLAKDYDLAPPCIVPSYHDAEERLDAPEPYHLVIVDLQLPWATREMPDPGNKSGLALVGKAAERDRFPVPALLVISGQLSETRYDLQDQLRREFFYGRTVNKSVDEEEAIIEAIRHCQRYTDIGIHLETGDTAAAYPPFSPREEDMLRRCILAQSDCLGCILSWWSAERDRGGAATTWTKVFQGRLLMDGGHGLSRPLFFKFTNADFAGSMHRDSLLMANKLPHIKVVHHEITRRTALLVTEKVGESDARPVSLASFLQRPDPTTANMMVDMARSISLQLDALGRTTEDQVPLSELLWSYHDRGRIEAAWERFGTATGVKSGRMSPVQLFDELAGSSDSVWVSFRNCTHGDLNITNVAVDEGPYGVRGYIFDAAGMGRAPAVRDLAALEVTALLHQPLEPGRIGMLADSLVERCRILYESFLPEDGEITVPDFLASNTMSFVVALRREALRHGDAVVYALLVFDQVLIQLAGLTFGLSGNKIAMPEEAGRLAAHVTRWTRNLLDEDTVA
jgi:CheY-like chemotaxis protein